MCMGMGMCVSMDVSFLLVLSHFILSFSLPPSAPSPLLCKGVAEGAVWVAYNRHLQHSEARGKGFSLQQQQHE
jgi:hypothetical protein